jgi:U3 small nucleolar ribonucleoprotein component
MPKKDREDYNAYMREYSTNRYRERRESLILEMGGKCVKCAKTSDLEFDHIDPETKSFNISKRLTGASMEDIRAESIKCQLLCVPCHKEKTSKASFVGHGGGKTGVAGCRCILCAPLKNANKRKLRRAKAQQKPYPLL